MAKTGAPKWTSDLDRIHWDEIIAEMIEARRGRDGAQWKLGDNALEVAPLDEDRRAPYGEHALELCASQVGVSVKTLAQYRGVAWRYPQEIRDQLSEHSDNLSYDHFLRAAAREDRLDWLRKASLNGWSSGRMFAEIRKATPPPPPSTRNRAEAIIHLFETVEEDFRRATNALAKARFDEEEQCEFHEGDWIRLSTLYQSFVDFVWALKLQLTGEDTDDLSPFDSLREEV